MTLEQKKRAVDTAVEYVRRAGYEIIERNSTSLIDLVAWERQSDTIVFFRVKAMKAGMANRRITTVSRKSKADFKRQCASWRRANKWQGNTRIDTIHIYGDATPVIDHIQNVWR